MGRISIESSLKETTATLKTANDVKICDIGKAVVEFGIHNANLLAIFSVLFTIIYKKS